MDCPPGKKEWSLEEVRLCIISCHVMSCHFISYQISMVTDVLLIEYIYENLDVSTKLELLSAQIETDSAV